MPEISSSVMAKMAIVCSSSDFGMSFFSTIKVEFMHRGFALQLSSADASALPIKIFTQLNTPSAFLTESFMELFRFVQPTFPGERAFPLERKRTLRNPNVNANVASLDKRSIGEGTVWYMSTTHLHQDCLKKDGARVWFAKRRALLNVWTG